jgi:hypothetical protein
MGDKDTVLTLFAVALAFGVFGAWLGAMATRDSENRLCRHTIQRSFGVTRDEAQSLIDEERKEDW